MVPLLHPEVFVKGQGLNLEFDVSPRQEGRKLAGKQIAVAARDEDRIIPLVPIGIEHFLEPFDFLNLVKEQVFGSLNVLGKLVDHRFEFSGGSDTHIAPFLQADEKDVALWNPSFEKFLANEFHQGRFAASSQSGEDLDDIRFMVEAAKPA